ncbi:MAG: NAD-dependent epimerase/dehydratase family protein [Ignavibacteria bacterium]|nr:NAD-dependent epimerase/dehydratase family protein [Ignavibacteria bacterium]
MKILIIGGTIFLGKHIVKIAQERGHEVVLFNRGKHNQELFPEIEKIWGDRLSDLELLRDRTFDSVIDTCGYFPRAVRMSTEFMRNKAKHYTFISSISVYKEFDVKGLNEDSATAVLEDETVEEVTGETYGALKRLCEIAAEEVFGADALNIRPGLIVGEDDPSDRFTYWVSRIAKGGEIAVPDSFGRAVQFIDVKDLAAFTLDMIEKGAGGIYNATGPDKELSFGEFLNACMGVAGTDPEFIRMSEEFILENNIAPYTELPLWVPESWSGTDHVDISKALGAGLKFRPLLQTIADTLSFDKSRNGQTLRSGLSPEKESELIAMLKGQN